MKTISKILSIVLVLSLVLGFALVGTAAETTLATFTFPANSNTSMWQDGNDLSVGTEFANNGYTLTVDAGNKVYTKGNDGNGRGFIKFGTTSVVGTLTFTVPSDVTRVELQLAGYKAKTSKYSVNGGAAVEISKQASQTAGTASEYDVVSVDTSSNKTVTIATVTGATRMVMFSVTYYGGTAAAPSCDHDASKLTYDYDSTGHWQDCSCGAYSTAISDHDGNATCVCGYTAPAYVAVPDGEYTIAAAGKFMSSIAATSGYGYPPALDAANSTCVYTVENATGNQFYLKDANGRYVYNTGTYKNVSASATKPASGGLWAVVMSGTTQLLVSVETGKALQYGTQYGTFQFVDDHSAANAVSIEAYVAPSCQHVDADGDYLCDNGCGEVIAPAADSTLTLEQANALGVANSTYTADKYYVTGVITEIASDMYGNMWIEDESGNKFYIYGTYSADGETRYDALTNQPQVGDKITVYGIIGQYGGASQMKNGWITGHNTHTCVDADNDHKCDDCGETVSECDDADNDHLCDICGEDSSVCDDADLDHACDICDAEMGDHTADVDGDHKCDYCDAVISDCVFNSCDYITTKDGHSQSCTCGEVGTEEPHVDADGDYLCDVCEYELEVPKTGDISLLPAVIMAVLSATGTALVIKKKVF